MGIQKEITKLSTIFSENLIGSEVTIAGWVKSIRNSKKFSFIVMNDGTTFDNLQVVADAELATYQNVLDAGVGAALKIKGKLVESPGKGQSVEMQGLEVEILGNTDESYPLQKKGHSLEFLREKAHLRPRTNTFSAVFKVRSVLAKATHDFFFEKNFYYLNSPIITGSDAEGAGEMFNITTFNLEKDLPKNEKGEVDYQKDYFGKSTHLTVSGQLSAECFALGMGGVYTFGPTFRSENSNTARHLAEFWMIEPEAAFYDLDDMADLAGEYIQRLISDAFKYCGPELEFLHKIYAKGLGDELKKVQTAEFQKVTYTEAIDILKNSNQKFEFPVEWGMDLQTEHERYLSETHFKGPVTVTDYPKDIKAFYMKLNEDGKTVRAMDVLVPGVGELIGGSQREDNLELLEKRIADMEMDMTDYWWYLELRKYGSAPHSGFGLGFERAVMYITGMSNIRDVIPFPRTPKNAEF